WRGIAGCSAKMLSGHDCADPEPSRPWDGGLRHASTAVANVEKMRFVGLTEAWDEECVPVPPHVRGQDQPGRVPEFPLEPPRQKRGLRRGRAARLRRRGRRAGLCRGRAAFRGAPGRVCRRRVRMHGRLRDLARARAGQRGQKTPQQDSTPRRETWARTQL
ncbi:unnamed protein product, partial [Prorocentrum cordatum]